MLSLMIGHIRICPYYFFTILFIVDIYMYVCVCVCTCLCMYKRNSEFVMPSSQPISKSKRDGIDFLVIIRNLFELYHIFERMGKRVTELKKKKEKKNTLSEGFCRLNGNASLISLFKTISIILESLLFQKF